MKRKLFCILLSAVLLLSALAGMKLQVSAASDLKASDECIEMLKAMEGFSAKPYWDYSQYSVGYGTACPSEEDRKRYEEEGISEEEAEMLLRKYVETSEIFLNSYLIDKYSVPMTQNQFDALILFTYNCGTSWIVDSTGSLHKAVVSGATGNDFLFPFSRWCNAGGKVQKYLLDRRMKEANIYLNGVYSTAVPDCFGYVIYDGNGGTQSAKAQGYILAEPVASASTATLEGSTFSGWYTAKTGGTKVELLDAAVKGKTLYAQWNVEGETPPETTEPENDVPETTVPEDTKPETPDRTESVKVKVTGDYVNIRKGPGTGYAVVTNVRAGKEITITETAQGSGYNWGKFTDGWICLKYTNYDSVVSGSDTEEKPEPETPSTPQKVTGIIQVDSTLRIRSGAGTSYSITGYLSSGAEVEILEQKTVNGVTWGKISKGWISMDYVKLDASTKPEEEKPEPETPDTKPEEKPTEPPASNTVIATGTVTTDDLRVRSAAGTGSTVLGYLSKGTRVEIYEKTTANGMAWGKTGKGWISLDYVKLDSSDNSSNSNTPSDSVIATGSVINTNNLRVRSAAGTHNSIVGYLTMGTKVEIYERTTVGSMVWGRIDQGWISLDYVKLDSTGDSNTASGTTKTVNTSSLRIRSGAGTNNSIVGYLTMGQKVEILEQTTVNGTPWGRISSGWISLDYVK